MLKINKYTLEVQVAWNHRIVYMVSNQNHKSESFKYLNKIVLVLSKCDKMI